MNYVMAMLAAGGVKPMVGETQTIGEQSLVGFDELKVPDEM